jgi:predicted enzyme related to lactoylglutathione lyase
MDYQRSRSSFCHIVISAPDLAKARSFKVDDMRTILDLITKHGGTAIQDRGRIGDVAAGYDAYFLDPNGNEMGLYSHQ